MKSENAKRKGAAKENLHHAEFIFTGPPKAKCFSGPTAFHEATKRMLSEEILT